MIRSFRHKGLKRFFETGSKAGINPDHAAKLRRFLGRLDAAQVPSDMGLPGHDLHPLTGDLEGSWSVTVNGNWRLTFRMQDQYADDVDYLDYH